MYAMTTPEQIGRFRLAALRGGVKLEMVGMKRSRGKSATAVAKRLLGLPRSAKREEVLAKIEELLSAMG